MMFMDFMFELRSIFSSGEDGLPCNPYFLKDVLRGKIKEKEKDFSESMLMLIYTLD